MQDVILFGASNRGIIALNALKPQYNIKCFCDNDKSKWGTYVNGVEVVSPDQIKNMNNPKVIITSQYADQITDQLDTMGVNPIMTV